MNPERSKKTIKPWLFITAIIVILVLDRLFGLGDTFIQSDFVMRLDAMVEENMPMAIAIYLICMVIACVLLALPGFVFALIAGSLFGPVLGTILCSIGATLGAMLAFLVGRYFLHDTLKPLISRNAHLKKWLFDTTGVNQATLLMITRLVPVFPYNLQNFAYGLTSMRFGLYSILSLLFMLPGVALYTFAAAGVFNPVERPFYFAIAGVLTVLVIASSLMIRRRYLERAGDRCG